MFDSSKSSVNAGIAPFLPQEIAIIDHSTLHQKRTLSIRIYLPGIDTDPVTYPTDARRRRRLIPVLSHIPRGRTQAPRSYIRAYTPRRLQNIQKILSLFISNKKYKNITIKRTCCIQGKYLLDKPLLIHHLYGCSILTCPLLFHFYLYPDLLLAPVSEVSMLRVHPNSHL